MMYDPKTWFVIPPLSQKDTRYIRMFNNFLDFNNFPSIKFKNLIFCSLTKCDTRWIYSEYIGSGRLNCHPGRIYIFIINLINQNVTKIYEFYWNKKVLLRERKRYTDHGVASTRYVAPGGGGRGNPLVGTSLFGKGYPPVTTWEGGTPHQLNGVPPIQTWEGGTPISWMGYPTPIQTWEGGTPRPDLGRGYPCQLDGVLPPSRPGKGVPPVNWMGYVPPPPTNVNKVKTLPPLVLRTRSVINFGWHFALLCQSFKVSAFNCRNVELESICFCSFQSGGYSDAASTRSYGSSHSGGSLGSGSYGAGRTSGAGGYSSGGYDSLPPRPYSTYDTPSSWRSSAYGSGSGAGTYGSSAGYSSGTSG